MSAFSFPGSLVFVCNKCGLQNWLSAGALDMAACRRCEAPLFSQSTESAPLKQAIARLLVATQALAEVSRQTGIAVLLDPSAYEPPAGTLSPGFYIGMPPPDPEHPMPLRPV